MQAHIYHLRELSFIQGAHYVYPLPHPLPVTIPLNLPLTHPLATPP